MIMRGGVYNMNEIIKRLNVEDIYKIKLDSLKLLKDLNETDEKLNTILEPINGYRPYNISYRFENHEKNQAERYIDRTCWNYLISIFQFKKYMLCTDYDKLRKDIDNFNIPEFNILNAENWIANVKELIYDNINKLVKKVFQKITEETYYTGSGYSNRQKKKRNNNGIDKIFILTTYDYNQVFNYWSSNPTLTDDLEKVCYILSGKKIPNVTLKDKMRMDKINEFKNEYFRIKLCKNGNTHYWLNEDIRNKLNLYGSGEKIIGENIRIKIME
jgi:hypothetical protein